PPLLYSLFLLHCPQSTQLPPLSLHDALPISGTPILAKTEIPQQWRELAASELSLDDASEMVASMTDGADVWWRSWEIGYDPADMIDQSIMATRKAVFPMHGLDPRSEERRVGETSDTRR